MEIPEKVFGIESSLAIMFLPLVGLVVLIIISVNLVIIPKLDDYNNLRTELKSLEARTLAVVEKTRYLQSVDSNELKKNTQFISSALLPQRNSYLLVGVVRKIADQYGFQVDSFMINPGKINEVPTKKEATNVSKIPVVLSLIGPNDKYLDLVKGLERSLPVLSLDSFDMKNEKETSKLDLQISAYYIEDQGKTDISKLTLADLTLKKEETDLLSKLNEFVILENAVEGEIPARGGVEFQRYNRPDPFNP